MICDSNTSSSQGILSEKSPLSCTVNYTFKDCWYALTYATSASSNYESHVQYDHVCVLKPENMVFEYQTPKQVLKYLLQPYHDRCVS